MTRKGPTVADVNSEAAQAREAFAEDHAGASEESLAAVEAQYKEYGTYVAVAAIDHEGARAYNIGDPVPVSNVKQYGYDKQKLVEKRG